MDEVRPETRAVPKREVVIRVQRRLDEDSCRLTFARLPDIPAEAFLRELIAIDGDTLLIDIAPEFDLEIKEIAYNGYSSLGEALARKRQSLIEFLGRYGYQATFQ